MFIEITILLRFYRTPCTVFERNHYRVCIFVRCVYAICLRFTTTKPKAVQVRCGRTPFGNGFFRTNDCRRQPVYVEIFRRPRTAHSTRTINQKPSSQRVHRNRFPNNILEDKMSKPFAKTHRHGHWFVTTETSDLTPFPETVPQHVRSATTTRDGRSPLCAVRPYSGFNEMIRDHRVNTLLPKGRAIDTGAYTVYIYALCTFSDPFSAQ